MLRPPSMRSSTSDPGSRVRASSLSLTMRARERPEPYPTSSSGDPQGATDSEFQVVAIEHHITELGQRNADEEHVKESVAIWAATFTETAQLHEAAIRTEVHLQASKAELDAYRYQLNLEALRAHETLRREHEACEGSIHSAQMRATELIQGGLGAYVRERDSAVRMVQEACATEAGLRESEQRMSAQAQTLRESEQQMSSEAQNLASARDTLHQEWVQANALLTAQQARNAQESIQLQEQTETEIVSETNN